MVARMMTCSVKQEGLMKYNSLERKHMYRV